jgi:hypothetical protein
VRCGLSTVRYGTWKRLVDKYCGGLVSFVSEQYGGEGPDDTDDFDAVVDDYRHAINAALPDGVFVDDEVFYGPEPVIDADIKAAVKSVDLIAIVKRHSGHPCHPSLPEHETARGQAVFTAESDSVRAYSRRSEPDPPERLQWTFVPFKSVGPLRFGMSREQAVAAVDAQVLMTTREFIEFHEMPVRTYFDEGRLCGVAMGALGTPQVVWRGIRLVGRPPSEVESELIDQVAPETEWYYSQHGDPGSDEIGLVVRTQRVIDVLLTRPVFVAESWAEDVCIAHDGRVPVQEWMQR